MRILIGVDDSVHSRAAIDLVRRMTWPADTRVTVVSVAQPLTLAYSDVYMPVAAMPEITEEWVRTHRDIAALAAKSLAEAGLLVESKVLEGDPRACLIDAATKERADLLVVGSHGRTGLAKLFMGSVANHVVAHAPCSVLVVKLDAA